MSKHRHLRTSLSLPSQSIGFTYTVEQCLVTLARMYQLTCQGKTPDGTNPFPLTQREEAIGTAWRAGYLRDYIETDNLVVISTASGKETPTDIAHVLRTCNRIQQRCIHPIVT